MCLQCMNSRGWLEILYVHLSIIYWYGAYKWSSEMGWDATGYVGWTEDELPLPDAASEVSYCKADASCLTCWPLNGVNISRGLFASYMHEVEKYRTLTAQMIMSCCEL